MGEYWANKQALYYKAIYGPLQHAITVSCFYARYQCTSHAWPADVDAAVLPFTTSKASQCSSTPLWYNQLGVPDMIIFEFSEISLKLNTY